MELNAFLRLTFVNWPEMFPSVLDAFFISEKRFDVYIVEEGVDRHVGIRRLRISDCRVSECSIEHNGVEMGMVDYYRDIRGIDIHPNVHAICVYAGDDEEVHPVEAIKLADRRMPEEEA